MSCSSPERELVTFWLAGTLDPADAELVSRHVETCADCRADLADGRRVVEGLRELHLSADEVVAVAAGELTSPHVLVCSGCRDEVALLRTVNADLAARSPASTRGWRPIAVGALGALVRSASPDRTSFRYYWPASIAAMLVIGVAAGLLYRNSPPAPIKTPSAMTPPPATIEARAEPIEPLSVRVAENRALILRRPGASSQAFLEAFDRAIEPYRRGRFAEAVDGLTALGKTYPDAPEPPLYEGVAQLLSGHPDAAVEPLDRAGQLAKGSEWQPDAEYYGARARLASGREEEGRQILMRLCAASGPYQSQACRAVGGTAPIRGR